MRNAVKARRRLLFSVWLISVAVVAVGYAADVEVKIKEWKQPSEATGGHDVMMARDGAVWYGGIESNTLVRFDPKSEQFTKVYLLKTPDSRPHGLVEDQEGNIWYTSSTAYPKTHVGKLNPKTGEITEYRVPHLVSQPEPLRAHTPLFDRKGRLWFTLSGSNQVARLDPKTGEMKVIFAPYGGEESGFTTVQSRNNITPYGLKMNSEGTLIVTNLRDNLILSIDPDTMAVREYRLPEDRARPRRLDITPDDAIWYTDWTRGMLARFDIKTGEFQEWLTPGGAWADLYGLVAVGWDIWMGEGSTGNIVRFDTKTHRFQSWHVPSGCGRARHIVADAGGNPWFVCKDTNTLGKAEVMGEGYNKSSAVSSMPPRRD